MLASGVWRSCETASSSADFNASLCRAISVSVAARCNSSRRSASASWSAASASSRVDSRVGSGAPGGSSARSQPSVWSSASIRIRRSVPVAVAACPAPGEVASCARAHLAGRSPGRPDERRRERGGWQRAPHRRVRDHPRTARPLDDDPGPLELGIPERDGPRSRPAVARSGAVARRRLIANNDVDSAARRAASCCGSDPSAASRPTTIATNRNSSRSSHSRGSATMTLNRGAVKAVVDEERRDRRPERRPQARTASLRRRRGRDRPAMRSSTPIAGLSSNATTAVAAASVATVTARPTASSRPVGRRAVELRGVGCRPGPGGALATA